MNDNFHDEFDDLHDPELERALGALAPASTDDAFARAMPHFARARRRHRAMTATLAVAASVVVVVGISLAGRNSGLSGVHTVPAHHGTSTPDNTTPNRPPDGGTNPDGTPKTTRDTSGTSSPKGPSGNTPPPNGGTTSTTTRINPPPASGGGTHRQTFTSAGGSIVVDLGDRTVSLVSQQAANGYTADIRLQGPTEVDVRFRVGGSGQNEHRIRLRFDSNGALIPEIT
jgi:hypothetical protein